MVKQAVALPHTALQNASLKIGAGQTLPAESERPDGHGA